MTDEKAHRAIIARTKEKERIMMAFCFSEVLFSKRVREVFIPRAMWVAEIMSRAVPRSDAYSMGRYVSETCIADSITVPMMRMTSFTLTFRVLSSLCIAKA